MKENKYLKNLPVESEYSMKLRVAETEFIALTQDWFKEKGLTVTQTLHILNRTSSRILQMCISTEKREEERQSGPDDA